MLRLQPTVIAITPAEVVEVGHRCLFRKFLECKNDNHFIPGDIAVGLRAVPGSPPPHRTVSWETEPRPAALQRSASLQSFSGLHLPVTDTPWPSPPGPRNDEDLSPQPGPSRRQDPPPNAGEPLLKGARDTFSLCLRPRHGQAAQALATTEGAHLELEGSVVVQDLPVNGTPENLRHIAAALGPDSPAAAPPSEASCSTGLATPQGASTHTNMVDAAELGLENEPGPSTPYRPSPTASVSASGLVSPAFSHRDSPEAFDDIELSRMVEVSSHLQTVRTAEHLRVYNDLLPASSQPQTPQNLPEARHQSRLQGSYTAPVRRNSAQHGWTPTTATRSRRGRGGQRREHSPLGLQTPGFMGLYGGTENLDDAVLVEQMDELGEGVSRSFRARLSEGDGEV